MAEMKIGLALLAASSAPRFKLSSNLSTWLPRPMLRRVVGHALGIGRKGDADEAVEVEAIGLRSLVGPLADALQQGFPEAADRVGIAEAAHAGGATGRAGAARVAAGQGYAPGQPEAAQVREGESVPRPKTW